MATASTSSHRRALLMGTDSGRDAIRRIAIAVLALFIVTVAGTVGYVVLGFGPLDALYQTVTTVATVGFREVQPLDHAGKVFTMVLILLGVGTVLYNLGVLVEAVVEGDLPETSGGAAWTGRSPSCTTTSSSAGTVEWAAPPPARRAHGRREVVVDSDPLKREGSPSARARRRSPTTPCTRPASTARALIAALGTDADNIYVTLSARALRPDLVIISRARTLDSKAKLTRAGANRVVNPS